MSEGDSVSSGFSQAFVDNIVKVSDIPSTTTQEALVIYFQSEASSGGGEVVQNGCVRLNDNQALVVFTEKRSKQRVLSRDHVLNDTQLKVTPFPDTGEEVPHAQGGSGSHHGYGLWDSPLLGSFQMCQPHFENPWSKGTPTDGVNYSYGNGHSYHQVMNTNDVVNYPPMADVSSIWTDTPSKVENFIPAESADGALAEQETSHGYLSINEIENVTPPPGFGEKCKTHERRLLEVTGFKDGTTTEMIELFFESKKKSGGGDIKDFQFDVDKNKAFIEFDDPKDLDSVLSKTELVLGGTRIKVKVYAPKPKTAVSVTGMREETTMETLELYFENPKRSKGDDVKTIRMNEAQTVAVIDYGSVEVAERVAAKKDHVLSNASLTVIRCSPDDESEAEEMSLEDEDSSSDGDYQQTEQLPMTAIRVTNFNPETPDETLVLFFESPKRCGGGEILSIRVNEERTVAVIDYGSVEVAERVATTSELIVDRSLVAVNACCPDVSVEPISSEAGLAVDVSGFKPSSPEEMIKHFFENKKKSRGGPILSMKLLEDVDPRTYRIVFQKSDDAIRVLKKKNLKLDSAELIVAVASDAGRSQAHTCATSVMQSEHPDQAQPATTIRVRGLPKDTSHDLLENFFQNRRKSGGGEIDKIEIDEAKQTALVTFADSSAADRVYQNRLSLQLNKTPIDVELVQPHKPKKKLPLDPYKVVVSNIPEDISHELLFYYIGNHTRCDVDAIRYGEKPGLGIVLFEQVPDIHKLREACTKKPLQKSVLQIEPVYLTDSIQVHDLPPNCTDDTLENYFENKKKSGGGEVEKVVIHGNGKVAVITFADHTDVQRVIEKKHKVSKCVLKVCEYYEQLGLRHPDDDSSKPVARIPDDAVVGPFDVSLVNFVCSSVECRQLLDNELRRHHGRANWETSTADSLVVTCFLSSSEQLAEMAWENVVKTAVVNFFADYKTESINILQHIWTDLVTRLSSHANGKVLIETIEEGHSIRLTGVRSIVDEVLRKVNEDRKTLEEEFNRKSQEVTETVTTLRDFELLFLQEMKFGVSGCKCEIDVTKKHVQFIGIPLDVNKAKSDMYEILRNLISEKVVSTPVILRLLKNPECHKYIHSQFRSSNVAASWTATDTDISVFASDKNVSRKAAQIMSRELHEALVSLQAESKPLLTSSQWKSVKESQLTQYRGCLEIVEHSDLTQLTIAGTRSVTPNVLEVVQDFFESNTIYERKIRLSSGRFRFMEQYNETGVVQIQESLKTHHVSICFVADSTSIVIKGTNKGVGLTQRKISNLMCKVICKNIEIAEPGMDEFFNCQRGKSFLETVERKNKCIIVFGEDDVCDEVIQGDMTKHKVDVIVNAANGKLKNAAATSATIGGLAVRVFQGDITKQATDAIVNPCNSDLDLSMGAWTSTVGSDDDEEGVPHSTPQLLETNIRIFGSKDSDITKAIEEIKKLCKDELCDVVMDGSLDKEYAAIRLLTKDEIATARAIDLKHHVRIDLNERIHRIRIRGRTECVLKAKDEIKQILHSADQRNILEEQAELLAKHVQWIFEENQEWAPYSSMSNLKIEQAYSKRESKVKFSENGFDCEIDFGRMMEHVSWKVPVPVQRVEKAAEVEDRYTFTTPEGLVVRMLTDDITKVKAGAIVNPTDCKLSNAGGISQAIASAGGEKFGKMTRQIVESRQRSRRYIVDAEAIEQDSTGKLLSTCWYVTHAVAPTNTYFREEHQYADLQRTFYNILNFANTTLEVKSVAVPLIGTGVRIFSVPECAKTLQEVIVNFSRTTAGSRILNEIIIVNKDSLATDAVADVFRAYPQQTQSDEAWGNSEDKGLSTNTTSVLSHEKRGPYDSGNRYENSNDHSSEMPGRGSSAEMGGRGLKSESKLSSSHINVHGQHEENNTDVVQAKALQSRETEDDFKPFFRPSVDKRAPSWSDVVKKSPDPRTSDPEDGCSICFNKLKDPKVLPDCKHSFCTECIMMWFKQKKTCPLCNKVYGVLTGNQPLTGTMRKRCDRSMYLAGYGHTGAIILTYDFPDGIQGKEHPNPGKRYTGTHRTAYLPNTAEGNEVAELLRRAFDARLVFTVGRSVTTGADNCVIWNDIHHKTRQTGGPAAYGYPDPGYLPRVREELRAKGIE